MCMRERERQRQRDRERRTCFWKQEQFNGEEKEACLISFLGTILTPAQKNFTKWISCPSGFWRAGVIKCCRQRDGRERRGRKQVLGNLCGALGL